MAMNMEAMLKITANVAGENNIRRLGNSMQGLEGRIKNASMATNLLYTGLKSLAAVAVTGGVVALAKSAIDLADDMRDLSQRTGVGVETLGQFKVAAELSGTSLEGVAKGLTFLNKNMVAAATGTEAAAAAFKTIGVATTEADGTLRSADKVFLDVADRFAQLRDGPEKAALALKIFGKAGAELIPILNLGSQEIQRFGLGIGPDFADKADAFNDQLGLMKAQTTVLTVQIGSALLPVMSGLVSVVTQAITFVGNLAGEFYKAIGGAAGLQQVAAGLIKTMVVLGGVTAGIFIATNITNFVKAMQTLHGITKGMLLLERAMLAVQTARAAVLSLIAGLQTPGPAQAKAVGLVTGGLVGAGLAVGLSKLIDDITKKIGTSLQGAMTMPNIPTPPPGTTPDLSGLRTGAGAKPKKEADMSERMYQLRLALNAAELKGETLKAANLRFDIASLKYEESKLKTRQDAIDLADAEKTMLQTYGDVAAQIGSDIAKDFLKRNELQENYNRIVEDLQIKAGLITGDKLKQVEIDRELQTILERLPGLTQAQIDKLKELVAASKQVKDGFGDTFGESLRQYYDSLKNFGGQVADSVKGAFQGLEDQLTSFVTTGKANFTDLANSIIADIARIAIRQAIIRPLVGGIFDIFNIKPSAMGNVFAQNGIQKFARGGIVDRPTMFPFANGIGLMGEAGPEAIMPLRRGRDGRLGVQAANGGGAVSVVVNVDASGTSVQGDNAKGAEFGRAISEAVKNEIVIQKRPGGLLN
jgi:lambda family phage tail tape measure protein